MPIELSWGYLFAIGVILLFVGGAYWYVRKILLSFRQGIDQSRR